jgi:small neutral amino acid transporter SnatA (MarC family)
MSSLIVNIILGFWLVLFGVMALFPLLMGGQKSHQSTTTNPSHNEDRVISILPVATPMNRPRTLIPGQPLDAPQHEDDSTPHAA